MMNLLLSMLGLAITFAVNAAPVKPGQAVVFAGKNDFCLLDEITANVIVSGCHSTDQGSITWVVQAGSAQSGTGPAGPIIFNLDSTHSECLTVNGTVADGTKLITTTCTPGNPLQQWNVNGDSTITLAGTNKCVDLTNGDTTFGNPVQIFTCFAGNTNQKWLPAPPPPGRGPNGLQPGSTNVVFEMPEPIIHEDGCLTASSNNDGASVVLQTCDFGGNPGAHSQNWTLSAGSSFSGKGPIGTISTFGGTKCLDLTNGVSTNGNKLQIWTCANGNTNQRWQVNGDSSISWAGGNKCVDNTNGNLTNGNRAQIWDCVTGNQNQAWLAGQSF